MDIRIVLSQMNVIVGDLPGNARKIIAEIKKADDMQADIILFPELTVCGYPPMDLILEADFVRANEKIINEIAAGTKNTIALVGCISRHDGKRWNSIAVMQNGKIIDFVRKTNLPTYDVFDELRYFEPNERVRPVPVTIRQKTVMLGIEICEDLWDERYHIKVTRELAEQGADIILNASASPYSRGKCRNRIARVREKVKQFKLPFIYVNLVGGQDELIFDGNSFAMDANGRIAVHLPSFEEATTCCRLTDGISDHPFEEKDIDEDEELYSALKTGIRDYFYKSGFKDAVIGLSGGIDSALVAALAADALGPEHVYAYALPSRFSSGHSLTDAELCARNLKIHYDVISIEPLYELFIRSLEKPFTGTVPGITEENLQARIRGTILMSIANKKNALLLTTGNKTELALGYCTMYGDMCGALAPISDMNKLEVYRLSRYINRLFAYDLIPESTLNKIPSAELAEGQYDPFDYDLVSPLVDDLLESDKSLDQIMADSGDPELVARVYELIRINEYKRWQAAPGLKVSAKAFGQGRRMPLVNHFKI